MQKEDHLRFLILESVKEHVELTSDICRLLSQYVRDGWLMRKSEIGAFSLTESGSEQLKIIGSTLPKQITTVYRKALNEIANEIANEIKTTIKNVDFSESWSKNLPVLQHPPEKLQIAKALRDADLRGFTISFDEERNKWMVSVPAELVEVAQKVIPKNLSEQVMVIAKVGPYGDLRSLGPCGEWHGSLSDKCTLKTHWHFLLDHNHFDLDWVTYRTSHVDDYFDTPDRWFSSQNVWLRRRITDDLTACPQMKWSLKIGLTPLTSDPSAVQFYLKDFQDSESLKEGLREFGLQHPDSQLPWSSVVHFYTIRYDGDFNGQPYYCDLSVDAQGIEYSLATFETDPWSAAHGLKPAASKTMFFFQGTKEGLPSYEIEHPSPDLARNTMRNLSFLRRMFPFLSFDAEGKLVDSAKLCLFKGVGSAILVRTAFPRNQKLASIAEHLEVLVAMDPNDPEEEHWEPVGPDATMATLTDHLCDGWILLRSTELVAKRLKRKPWGFCMETLE